MGNIRNYCLTLLLSTLFSVTLYSCDPEDTVEPAPVDTETPPPADEPANTPVTAIPDELVGTWYADHNDNPLTENWEKGTFQGEQGWREFRTMVFTKDGKNAAEYTSEIFNYGDEVKQYLYKRTGTLEYKSSPASLTFHAQSGVVRLFSNKYAGYVEKQMAPSELASYFSVLLNPEATTYTSGTNYLSAIRSDVANQYSVRYIKVGSGPATDTPGGDYSQPPATGTYVKIADKYYPTVTIGDQEWMSVNYAGAGGMSKADKPQYGTFCRRADLQDIPLPAGWRIPTKKDFVKLLKSQGLGLNVWGTTDGEDLASKKLLGQLMAQKAWLKQDGYASNTSGFTALPSNYMVQNATPYGEGTNCYLWTTDLDESENPVAFEIIQMPSDTYAAFTTFPVGYYPPHLPVRLVKDK